MLDDGIEHRCRIVDMSSCGVALAVQTGGRVGERVVCYLDHFGRIEGSISRLFEGGFAIEFIASPVKKEKLGNQLVWQTTRPTVNETDACEHERVVPNKKRAVLHLSDGRHIAIQLINLSITGVALTCPVPLTIGAAVTLGRHPGHVVRVAQRLAAIDFAPPLPYDTLDATIEL